MRTAWNGLPATRLQSADGASALIADHGAHLLSWTPAGAGEALFMSAQTGFGAGTAIRGGVPIIFPQFGERGSGRRHGFARTAPWRLESAALESGCAIARYALAPEDVPAAGWPHAFRLHYTVAIEARRLRLALTVHNPSAEEWRFHAALHTYLRVADVGQVRISGLQQAAYLDQAGDGGRAVQSDADLRIDGEVDRIYLDTPGALALHEGSQTLVSEQRGFRDTVIWNPGHHKAALLQDLTPGAESHFVCIEAAAVEQAITLAGNASWHGEQILTSV